MRTLRFKALLALVVTTMGAFGCADDSSSSDTRSVGASGGASSPGASGSGALGPGDGPTGGMAGMASVGTGGSGQGPAGENHFVFVETGEITHERDYFPLQYGDEPYVPADVPTSWLSPVDYSQGTMHMTLDVLDVPEGASAEFYYTVTFTQTDADHDEGWLRPAIHVVPGQTHYEDSWPVGDTQFVWNDGTEHTSTAAERWDFSRPFDNVAGDLVAWPNASFPIRVKLRIELTVP